MAWIFYRLEHTTESSPLSPIDQGDDEREAKVGTWVNLLANSWSGNGTIASSKVANGGAVHDKEEPGRTAALKSTC